MERIQTGVPHLDPILAGGIPRNYMLLIGGTPGSGKTILANQIAYTNATPDRRALIVTTVSEPLARHVRFMQQFSFFDVNKVGNAVLYDDVGPQLLYQNGEHLLHVIEDLVMTHQPALLVIDSFKAIHDLSDSQAELRRALYRLAASLATIECTAVLVGEYTDKELVSTPESTIVDGIVQLKRKPKGMPPCQYLQVHKLRGSDYLAGEHSYRIDADGFHVFPRFVTPSSPVMYSPSDERVQTHIPGLDDLLHGGLWRGTTGLVAGDPGVGKTVTALHFLLNGAVRGEPGVYISFQEDPNQLRQIALRFGFDIEHLQAQGMVEILYTSPVELDLNEHTLKMIHAIERVGARRVVVDSIDDLGLQVAADSGRYFEYMYSLVQWFKTHRITALLTAHMSQMFGLQLQLTAHGVSYIADALLILRYAQIGAEIHRVITVLSMRGSSHSSQVCRYQIRESEGPIVAEPIAGSFSLLETSLEG